jgi:hypothetical protein
MVTGDPEFVILKWQSWLDATKFEDKILGAVIKEFLRPTNNYVPNSPLRYNHHDLVGVDSITNFVLDNSGTAGYDAGATLGTIAGLSFRGNKEASVHLAGKLIRYKRIQQHDQFFKELRMDPAVRSTVPGWLSNKRAMCPPCLVVGIMICEDVELSFEAEQSRESEGHVEVPVGAIMLASGVTNPLGDNANPQAHASTNKQSVTIFKGSTCKSNIFALELKKITTQSFLSKQLRLTEEGPTVDPTRLAGAHEGRAKADYVSAEELVVDEFTTKEYEDMAD